MPTACRLSQTLDVMDESLAHFQAVCRSAFAFLETYAFREVAPSNHGRNPYVVEFSNSAIALRVVGEGWGTVAWVEYTSPEGKTVARAVLEADWRPALAALKGDA